MFLVPTEYNPSIYSPILYSPDYYDYNNNYYIKDELHFNVFAQNQIHEYIHYIFLDKWIFKYYKLAFKYIKNVNGQLQFVKDKTERDQNDVSNESYDMLKNKVDFIEKNILSKKESRKFLIRFMDKTGLKWYNLASGRNIDLVRTRLWRFVKDRLDEKIGR